MANPQTENGHVKIANEIFDALCRFRIPGESRQVLDFVIRKTYGFNKREDAISLSQFCSGTGLKKNTICKAIAHLVSLNLITKKGNDVANVYRFNKDFDSWKPLPKKVTLPKKGITITQKGKNRYPKRDIQKTVTKDTITKDREHTAQSAGGVNALISIFHDSINPTISYVNYGNRKSAQLLIEKFGLEMSTKYAKYAVAVQGKPYTPVITTPTQLVNKIAELKIYGDKEKNKLNQRKVIKI